jgi:hypothetical protein
MQSYVNTKKELKEINKIIGKVRNNRSELIANQFLSGQQKRYNNRLERKNTVSGLAWFILVFGLVGYFLSVAFFAG